MKNLKFKQCGFTIVELVIVMVVIGILSAVALPRMINLAKEARRNTTMAITSNLKTSVELLHAQWVAMSEPSVITTSDGISLYMGTYGWPQKVGTTSAEYYTAQDCIDLWNALMKNPPLAKEDFGCPQNGTCQYNAAYRGACHFTDKNDDTITYFNVNFEDPKYNGMVDVWLKTPENRFLYNPELWQ